MNKILVATFNTETDVYKGLDALKDLHEKGDITLYASSVFIKNPDGTITVQQAADEGPLGTVVGMLTGGVVGLLGGPAGVTVGSMTGGLAGSIDDINNAGVNTDIIDEVSQATTPGKVVLLAEVGEDGVTPVNAKISQLDGRAFRRPRHEFVEGELNSEAAAFCAETPYSLRSAGGYIWTS